MMDNGRVGQHTALEKSKRIEDLFIVLSMDGLQGQELQQGKRL